MIERKPYYSYSQVKSERTASSLNLPIKSLNVGWPGQQKGNSF